MAGLTGVAAGLRLPIFFANIASKAAGEIGKDLVKLMLRKSSSRVIGQILKDTKAWKKAFSHIAEHFTLQVLKDKGFHTVFKSAFKSEKAVMKLIVQTCRAPTKRIVTKATVQISGQAVAEGIPVTIIERTFAEAIGESFEQVVEGETKRTVSRGDCHILRVIVDYTGRVISAFPVRSLT
jgi:hypothetical protein